MGNNKMSSQESPFFARDDLSLRLMFESAAIMLLVEPETGIILEANPAAVQFYGYPRSKLCGMSIDEINALPAEQVALERQKAKNEGRINLVLPHRLANGEERIVEEISSIFVWQQKPVTFTIIHDITECLKSPTYSLNLDLREKVRQHEILLDDLRTNKIELEMQNQELRRTQGELLAARARYFDLYDLAPVGYCTISVDDLILETNLTAASLLDATRGAMVNTPFHRFVHPQYQPAYFLYRRQLFETGQPRTLDIKMQRQDGSHFWGHLEAIVTKEPLAYLKQDSAEPVAALVVISDISARKLAEENLYDLQWRLEMVIEATRAGTWVWNIQTGETIFNEIWAQICGYTLAELLPSSITTFGSGMSMRAISSSFCWPPESSSAKLWRSSIRRICSSIASARSISTRSGSSRSSTGTSRLSISDILRNTRGIWKVRPTPACAISCGVRPVMSRPPIDTVPLSAR